MRLSRSLVKKKCVVFLVLFLIGCLHGAVADGQIVFFGKMDADMQAVTTSRPGPGIASTRMRVATNASRIGARGSLELGGEMQAVWQIATRANLSGAETGAGGGLFTLLGNTRVGLKGNFGTVFLGVWDTPFRQAYDKIDLFDNSHIGSPIGVLGCIGNSIAGGATLPTLAQGFHAAVASVSVGSIGFHRRQKGSLQYWSPLIQQVQVRLAYSVDDPASKNSTVTPMICSFSAAYDGDPLYIAGAFERHQDMKVRAGVNITGIDMGVRMLGSYRIADGKIGIVFERLLYDTPSTGSAARNAWSVSGSYRYGPGSVGVIYTFAGDLTGTTDTGTDQVSFRCGYFLAELVELYGQYTTISNKTNGTYNFGDGLQFATDPGADLSGVGVGLAYAF